MLFWTRFCRFHPCRKPVPALFILSYSRGGGFVAKIWEGERKAKLVADLARFYAAVDEVKPRSSRKDSAEKFVVATGFKGVKSKKER